MQINRELIEYLEELSLLRLSAEEKEQSKTELNNILKYMDKLNELDTTDAQEISHPFSDTNCFRADKVLKSFDREEILRNAPDKNEEYYKAPKAVN